MVPGGGLPAIAFTQRPFCFVPCIGSARRHRFGQIHPGQARKRTRQCQRLGVFVADQDRTGLRTARSQQAREHARIDAGNGDDIFRLKISGQALGRTEIRYQQRQVFDDQAGGVNFARFDIFRIDPSIADMRIRERYDLMAVTRVSQNFLVTRH